MDEKALNQMLEKIISKVMQGMNIKPVQPGSASCCINTVDEIPVELSARHVHLSEQDAITLFGAPLTKSRDLSQPGQFLCNERVRLVGPKGTMENVAVLGPSRGNSQVEISMTDCRALGIKNPVVRQSGDVAGSPGITLASQTASTELAEGVIVASRHIHMSPDNAKKFCVKDGDMVHVRINGSRPSVLEDTLVRVNKNFSLAMHIDSDEGNSSGWSTGVTGKIVGKKAG